MISKKLNSFVIISSIFAFCFTYPIDLNLTNKSSDNLDFNIKLPNNDTIQINLSLRLLTTSNATSGDILPSSSSSPSEPPITQASVVNDSSSSTENGNESPVQTDVEEIPTEKTLVSVEEAIEGFRQDLISKEKEIGGIIESDRIFYRHFQLQFDGDKSIRIRCTYDSNYQERRLKISCYEYHEILGERILSNGEIEYVREHDPTYQTDITSVDLRKMKQTLNMDIS